ncbi:hypothetical protein HZB94_04780 [Candidatus Falkowbacteria bacterium]|nr:hypothetical protein [Candidatus Falkowbacteria bacterium]
MANRRRNKKKESHKKPRKRQKPKNNLKNRKEKMKANCYSSEANPCHFAANETARLPQLSAKPNFRPNAAGAKGENRYPLRHACILGGGQGFASLGGHAPAFLGDHGFAPRAWRIIKKIL